MRSRPLAGRFDRRWVRLAGVALAIALLAYPAAVWAGDRFADVPTTNVFHDDISWLADAGVTKGCNPPANTQFCPDAPVTRQQMAAFLKRLAESRTVDAGTVIGLEGTDLVTVGELATPQSASVPGGSVWTDVATYTYESGSFLFGGGVLLWARADVFNTTFDDTVVTCELEADQQGSLTSTQVDVAGEFDGDEVAVTLIGVAFDDDPDDFAPASATLRCRSTVSTVSVSNLAIAAVRADFLTAKPAAVSTSSEEARTKQP